jgi:hypothetical protein
MAFDWKKLKGKATEALETAKVLGQAATEKAREAAEQAKPLAEKAAEAVLKADKKVNEVLDKGIKKAEDAIIKRKDGGNKPK